MKNLEEKNCYTCDNKKCNITYSCIRQDVTEHHEVFDIDIEFDCVNHNKWKPLLWRGKHTEENINEVELLKKQNRGFIRLLEGIESALKGISKNADKEIVLYWIQENAIKVFKEEKSKGFSFEWID